MGMFKNKKGFSLVELMVVVVIMGILIAVAVPMYGAVTANAEKNTCATNIRNIKTFFDNSFANSDGVALTDSERFIKEMGAEVPKCPVNNKPYAVWVNTKTGQAIIMCPGADGVKHKAEDVGAVSTEPTGDDIQVVIAKNW